MSAVLKEGETLADRVAGAVNGDCVIVPDKASIGPGIVPLEFKVLVRPEDAGVDPLLARAKAAGLKLPEDVLAREFMAQIVAEFVAAGGNAFEDWKDARLPQPGDKVLMAKYAGITVRGADGVEYRMLNDKDISALITAEGVSRV